MSIGMLPVNVLVKIFNHLPFKERVRMRMVNRLFRDVSDESINRMRSLVINDELLEYVFMTQQFSDLLKSCSPTLESMDATSQLFNKSWFKALVQFEYPKLKNLKISVIDNDQTRKLISRCGNLRSISLLLSGEFQWAENMVFDNLERLEIRPPADNGMIDRDGVNLSSVLRPLIGTVPNLKQISITSGWVKYVFPVEELSQLLASAPRLEVLNLELPANSNGYFLPVVKKMQKDFEAAVSTWHLPNLTKLTMNFGGGWSWSSIKHKFPLMFPRLKSFTSDMGDKVDDRAILALSQLENLRELRLRFLEVSKEKFTQMITRLPSITVLHVDAIGRSFQTFGESFGQALEALSQLKNLRELLMGKSMSKNEIMGVITSVPSIDILNIGAITGVLSPEQLIEFVTSTAAQIQRKVEIRLLRMYIKGIEPELDQMEVVLEEMKNNGGPVVEVKRPRRIESIRYGSMIG